MGCAGGIRWPSSGAAVPDAVGAVRASASARERVCVFGLNETDSGYHKPCYFSAIQQFRGYMKRLQSETRRREIRGMLVHGGARKLRSDVIRAASLRPRVEVVQYRLQVDFAGGSTC